MAVYTSAMTHADLDDWLDYMGCEFECLYQGQDKSEPRILKGKVHEVKIPKTTGRVLVTLETEDEGFKSFYPHKAVWVVPTGK